MLPSGIIRRGQCRARIGLIPCYSGFRCRFWYMSYFVACSDAFLTLKNQGVRRGNLGR
jgi:hypothetical protein